MANNSSSLAMNLRRMNSIRVPADGDVLALDYRWPDARLIAQFRSVLAELTSAGERLSWPGDLSSILARRVVTELQSRGDQSDAEFKAIIRGASGLAAMLMHLEGKLTRSGVKFINTRRKRTEYSTYPTSPRVASALAQWVLQRIGAKSEARIIDPSMEGGPILLELALAIAKSKRSALRTSASQLIGVDKNPVSKRIVGFLLDTVNDAYGGNHFSSSLHCGDSFDLLERGPAFDAVVNNPPWGARTDGADGSVLATRGPYVHYRDPYIAYVSVALRRLRSEGAFGFVLPLQSLTAPSAAGLRAELLENSLLTHLVVLPRSAFPRATVRAVLLSGVRRVNGERTKNVHVVKYPVSRRLCDEVKATEGIVPGETLNSLGGSPWLQIVGGGTPFAAATPVRALEEFCSVVRGVAPYTVGKGCPRQTCDDLTMARYTYTRPRAGAAPLVRSCDIKWMAVGMPREYVELGPWLADGSSYHEVKEKRRVFVRQICGRDGRLTASPAPKGFVARAGLITVVCGSVPSVLLAALLGSKAAAHWVRTECPGFHKESFGRVAPKDLRKFPLPACLVGHDRSKKERGLCVRLMDVAAIARRAAMHSFRTELGSLMAEIDELVDIAYGLKVR